MRLNDLKIYLKKNPLHFLTLHTSDSSALNSADSHKIKTENERFKIREKKTVKVCCGPSTVRERQHDTANKK